MEPYGPSRPVRRNRVGSFAGTTLVLLVVMAVLLASRDLWDLQTRAAGELLTSAGVPHEVVTDIAELEELRVGGASRSEEGRPPHAPLIRVDTPTPLEPRPGEAAAMIAFAVAAAAALASARRFPAPLKGLVMVALFIASATLAYGAWWSPRAPLEVGAVLVDWRTSGLVPVTVVALFFAYEVYPLPGSFILKTVWASFALTATAVFATLRLALTAAGFAAFGDAAFLALFHLAGTFWDVLPGIAAIALAHASGTVTTGRRWWLP